MDRLNAYKAHKDGKTYEEFLQERNIKKEDFEKKTEKEQEEEFSIWFKSKKYRITTGKRKEKVGKAPIKKVDSIFDLIKKIVFNGKLNDADKIKLQKQAYSIKNLDSDIKNIESRITELKEELETKKEEYKKQLNELNNKLK